MAKIPVSAFTPLLVREVENHSIYVWGGSGELCKDVDEAWIRRKEARNDNGKHADEAVAAWKAVMASPFRDVARCFDCSGYVSWCLKQCGALDRRRDCDGLYAKCEKTDELHDGTLLFRVSSTNPNDETHVGVYYDNKQYHSKGRKYGVVAEPFVKSYWHKYGWFKTLEADEPEPTPTPSPTRDFVEVKGGSVYVRDGNGVYKDKSRTEKNKAIGIAHRGDMLPCYGQDDHDPYWYIVEFNGKRGYITCHERYTKLIKK